MIAAKTEAHHNKSAQNPDKTDNIMTESPTDIHRPVKEFHTCLCIKKSSLWIKTRGTVSSSQMIPPLRKFKNSTISILKSNGCTIFIVTLNVQKLTKSYDQEYTRQSFLYVCQTLPSHHIPISDMA